MIFYCAIWNSIAKCQSLKILSRYPVEVMTIIIHFHQSHYRDFKNYYLHYVCRQLKSYFPELLSYTRFLAVMPSVVVPMCSYLRSKLGKPTGIQFVDSTKIEVCHIIRAKRNKVFEGSQSMEKAQ